MSRETREAAAAVLRQTAEGAATNGGLQPSFPADFDPNILSLRARRWLQIGTYALTGVVAFYMVFEVDFGPREHVFSGLRRWYKRKFWTLTPEEETRLRLQEDAAAAAFRSGKAPRALSNK